MVVRLMSEIPGIRDKEVMRASMCLRTRGSPPVMRTLETPLGDRIPARRQISS